MKILVVQDYLRSGGTERQSLLLTRAFGEAGHGATLLTFRPGGELMPAAAGLPRRTLQSLDLGWDWFAPGLLRTARALDPDIVLCMGRMANSHGGFLQRGLPRARVLGTMRTGKPLPWLYRRFLRSAAHVVANSEDARRTLIHTYGLTPGRVSVIYNALAFPPGSPRETSLRILRGIPESTVVLLCVGMLRPTKNHRELLTILAGLPRELDWQLWLVGDGETRADCERLVAAQGLQSRVIFYGFQTDPLPYYRAADLAVLTSGSESLSNFLIEAQAHGLPAVAYAASGVGECFQPGVSGWAIPAGDATAFAEHLRLLILDREQRRRAGDAARQWARERFTLQGQTNRYLELFTRLLAP